MRRELFEAVGGFDTSLPGYEDWDFYLGALERGWRGLRVPEVVLDYRRHESLAPVRRPGRLPAPIPHDPRQAPPRSTRAPRSSRPPASSGAGGRLVYRTWWAWRPLPGVVEQALYRILFRARSRASSTSSAKRRASSG